MDGGPGEWHRPNPARARVPGRFARHDLQCVVGAPAMRRIALPCIAPPSNAGSVTPISGWSAPGPSWPSSTSSWWWSNEIADDTRVRALVAETPAASKEHDEASRHATAMLRTRQALVDRIAELERRQDELLDRLVVGPG